MQEIYPEIQQAGFEMVAVSPDRPAKVVEIRKKHRLSFSLFSDSKMEAAQAFCIAYHVDEQTLKQIAEFGIDLEEASGEAHHMLPTPSVFVVSKGGVIQFTYANPDYTVRVPVGILLAAVQAARK